MRERAAVEPDVREEVWGSSEAGLAVLLFWISACLAQAHVCTGQSITLEHWNNMGSSKGAHLLVQTWTGGL